MTINVPVTFGGLSDAIRGLDGIANGLGRAADAAVSFQRGQHAAGGAIADITGKVAAAAGGLATFGRMAGIESVANLGALAAASASTSAQFAQLGGMLGPQGAIVGAIAGALLPALAELVAAEDEAAEAARRHEQQTRDAIGTQEEYETAIRNASAALAQRSVMDAGLGTDEQYRARAEVQNAQARGFEANIAAVRQQLAAARESHSFWNDATEEVNNLTNSLRDLEGMRDTARNLASQDLANARRAREEQDASTVEDTERLARERAERERTRRPRSNDPAIGSEEWRERALADSIQASEALEEAYTEWLQRENQKRLDDVLATFDKERQEREAALRERREQEEAEARVKRDREAREAEERRSDAEKARNDTTRAERAEDARIAKRTDDWNTLFAIGTEVTTTLSEAVADVVLGNKSAEEAFDGLLKSFLEMISEYCSLMAAKEFAEAAAAFGQQNYGGGALHIAAGVGFTAVAIATGIGAAAINTAPSDSKPTEPQSTSSGGDQRGDTVINWNSPIVTAQTRAELGRDIRGLVRAADTRGM